MIRKLIQRIWRNRIVWTFFHPRRAVALDNESIDVLMEVTGQYLDACAELKAVTKRLAQHEQGLKMLEAARDAAFRAVKEDQKHD